MKILVFLLSMVVLAGCASGPSTPAVTAADAPTTEEILATEYTLGAGDNVRIIVFGEENLSGEFLVDGSGAVSLPLVGEVAAAGRTLDEFRAAVEARLADGYLNDPRVSAEVITFRPFYILGEVEEAGEYPYTDGLTVINAVARAGGFTYRARRQTVFIQRAGEREEREVPLTPATRVFPGDTIRIAERFF